MADTHSEQVAAEGMHQTGVRLLCALLAWQRTNLTESTVASSPGQVLLSSYSITLCLAMTMLGARGDTLRALAQALHQREDATSAIGSLSRSLTASAQASRASAETPSERTKPRSRKPGYLRAFRMSKAPAVHRTTDDESGVIVRVANAIFYRSGLKVLNEFQTAVRECFDSEVIEMSSDPVKQINAWCSEHTDGKIPEVLQMLPPTVRVVLANAVYFRARFLNAFDRALSVAGRFHRSAEQTLDVMFMRHERRLLRYTEDSHLQMIELPYACGAPAGSGSGLSGASPFSLVVALPKSTGPAALDRLVAKHANPDSWEKYMRSLRMTTGTLHLPRFEVEWGADLKQHLCELGAGSAFVPSANFEGIASETPLFLDMVIHKTFMKVDEEGTTAAAVTVVCGRGGGRPRAAPAPFRMIVDRPFLVAILHSSSKAVLFMGTIDHPKSH
mmetsp:Transcript_43239/g.109201  ORF Transcript_43239/g.109201 Transcript_43239/m.109201 type:complete len:445 (-) Transcript_43239:1299-2633(-)|eukprot:CAMPEP_0174239166 /NCGR_PEP_ID=MMETSP0417-20130205/13672_1 /TAXON_ID=242541 /ORGANISM="Mayorella sp, Strain BSH-02190019" /LENGTH=444 /DNA_ID=CAMNT_0015318079 /DNA_START=29 /DNA_END=1363 /DNA_ORIENTATION=+